MKTATTIIQIAAFGACFAVYVAGTGSALSGVRRAMQTMASTVQMTSGEAAAGHQAI